MLSGVGGKHRNVTNKQVNKLCPFPSLFKSQFSKRNTPLPKRPASISCHPNEWDRNGNQDWWRVKALLLECSDVPVHHRFIGTKTDEQKPHNVSVGGLCHGGVRVGGWDIPTQQLLSIHGKLVYWREGSRLTSSMTC